MANMLDYVDWRGDIPFTQVPLNEVDNLILSQLCYIDFEGIVPHDFKKGIAFSSAAKRYLRAHRGEPAYLGAILPPATLTLLVKAAKSKRFGKLMLKGYVNRVEKEEQLQFCAVTFEMEDGNHFIAFRGTDDTLVGWKESFNMSFLHPVPAQTQAVAYLKEAANACEGSLYLGGHSKGGNLAVYAAVKCGEDSQERIRCVFSNDGPGFTTEFITGDEYQSMKPKLRTFIPQSSVVGLLLEHEETYEVIKSNQTGLWQHDAFSWEVLGGSFLHLDSITKESRTIDRSLKNWLKSMDNKQRAEFVDAIYETLTSTNATTLTDINTDKIKLLRAWNKLDKETQSAVMKAIRILFRESIHANHGKKAKK